MSELQEQKSTAVVNVGLSAKVNLGNFESLGITIGVTDPAKPGETVKDAFDRIYSFVETQLNDKIEEAKKLGEED